MLRSPRGNPIVEVPGAVGGVWLDDRTRPPGFCRFALNVRGGEVRPGSQYNSAGGRINSDVTVYANGLHGFRDAQGTYRLLIVHAADVGDSGRTPRVTLIEGWRGSTSTALTQLDTTAAARRVCSWAVLNNDAFVAGPFAGQEIIRVRFDDDGEVNVAPLTAADRSQTPSVASNSGARYRLLPPRGDVVGTHQGSLLVSDGFTVYFSDTHDPEGWQFNSFFRLEDGGDHDRVTGFASVSNGLLLVLTRDAVYQIEGDLFTAGVPLQNAARRTAGGIGNLSPAGFQVVEGVIYMMSEQGPVAYSRGQWIPLGSSSDTPGGAGAIGPLFGHGSDIDSDAERYRPSPDAQALCISRYSRKQQAVEWAIGAITTSGETLDDRHLRLRYEVPSGRWSIEHHPSTRVLAAVEDGHDDEVLIAASGNSRMYFEGVGDFDQRHDDGGGGGSVDDLAIAADVQMPPFDFAPHRGRLRYVYVTGERQWASTPNVGTLRDGRSRDDEATRTVQFETRDRAFSSDGAGASTNGFILGTDALESEQDRTVRRGIAPSAQGQRVRVRVTTPTGAAVGHRWSVRSVQAELTDRGRGAT